MNMIILMGRLTKDPEVRSGNNTTVARYSLAVDRRFRREGDPEADFFNCTVFGKGAEFADKFLKKGTKVVVTGRMQQDNYTNKDGNKVYSWVVVVDSQEFAESKGAADNKPVGASNEYVPVNQADEELPFI